MNGQFTQTFSSNGCRLSAQCYEVRRLTLEVEVELLVELEGAVVVLPVLAEEGQEPLLCDL